MVPLDDNTVGHPFIYEKYCVAVVGALPPLTSVKSMLREIIDNRVFDAVQKETISAYIGALYITNLARMWG